MTIIKAKLRELKNADVTHVSLVGRGANRIPFRVIKSDKQESGMNLNDLRRLVKGSNEPEAPTISAFVVFDQPEAVVAKIGEKLKELGLKGDKIKKMDDGALMFVQDDEPEKDGTILRMSNDVIVIAKGFSPYNEALSQNADFNETLQTQGFFQNMDVACSALRSTVSNVMYKADSQASAVQDISTNIDKFKNYLVTLAKGLPQVAFKADKDISEIIIAAAEEAKKAEKPKEDPADTPEAKKEEQPKEEPKTEGEKPAPVAGLTAEQAQEIVAKAVEPLTQALTTLTNSLKAATDAQTALSARVDENARKTDDVVSKLKGTVVVGSTPDDQPAGDRNSASKSEDLSPFGNGIFDTAMMPSRSYRR